MKVAVIGCGAHSTQFHLPALRRYASDRPGRIELAAVCDLRADVARQRAEQFGFAAACDSVEQLLADVRPDACVAVTPIGATAEVALRIMDASVALLMEKPPGATLEQARTVADRAARAARPVMVSMNRRYDPLLTDALDWIGPDRRVRHVRGLMCREDRREPRFIAETALHAVDAVRHVARRCGLGEVRTARWQTSGSDGAAAAWYVVSFAFASGATGTLEVLPTAGHNRERYTMTGDGFVAEARTCTFDDARAIGQAASGGKPLDRSLAPETPPDIASGTYAETCAFLDAVIDGRPVYPTPSDTLPGAELVFAMAAASADGAGTWPSS